MVKVNICVNCAVCCGLFPVFVLTLQGPATTFGGFSLFGLGEGRIALLIVFVDVCGRDLQMALFLGALGLRGLLILLCARFGASLASSGSVGARLGGH